MKYSLLGILTLGVIHATARPQDAKAQTLPKASGSGKSGCSLKEVIIARGTSEGGKYGFIVGDPLVSQLKRLMPDITAYAVNYPADTNQAPGTEKGAQDVVKRIKSQLAACPNAQFALVGYSQGARVVRIGATRLDPAEQDHVVAAVVYGDSGDMAFRSAPKFPPKLLAKLKNNCYPGDPNCNAEGSFSNHLMYNSGTYHKETAEFIVAGFKGQPLPLKTNPPRVVSGDATSTGKAKSVRLATPADAKGS